MTDDLKKTIVTIAIEHGISLIQNISNIKKLSYEFSDSEDGEVILIVSQKEAPPRINLYVERIVSNYNSVEFQQNFRMSRGAFEKLLGVLNTNLHLVRGGENLKISAEKQLLAVIWILATPDSYRSIGERFDVAKSTLSNIFFRIVDFLNHIASTIIRFPDTSRKLEIKNYFEINNRLKGVVGAIGGTYVPCKVPADQKMAYTNRKLFTAVTLQAICDHKMRYIDCFVGYPSSVHDNRIFRNLDFYKNVQQDVRHYFDEGEKILGDKAYPLEPWCVPPFIDRGSLTDRQKRFNKTHASCRQVIERSFALLFGRFRRLRYLDIKRIVCVPSTILAACVLHNICIDFPDINVADYLNEGLEHAQHNTPEDIAVPQIITTSGHSVRNEMLENIARD